MKNLLKKALTVIVLIYAGSLSAQITSATIMDNNDVNIENTIIDPVSSPDFKYAIDYTTPSTGGPYKITIAQYGRIESDGPSVWLKTIVSIKNIEEGVTGSVDGVGAFVTENTAQNATLYIGNGSLYVQMQDPDKNYIGEAVTIPVTWDLATSIARGEAFKIKVYPNPATSVINIDAPQGSDVSIYNLAGNKVKIVENSTASVDDLPAGIYIVKIAYQGESVIKKIQVL